MTEHPCSKGLTKACLEADPNWFRRIISYKLLLLLIPKERSKQLHNLLTRYGIVPEPPEPPGTAPGTIPYPPGTPTPEQPPGTEPPITPTPTPPGTPTPEQPPGTEPPTTPTPTPPGTPTPEQPPGTEPPTTPAPTPPGTPTPEPPGTPPTTPPGTPTPAPPGTPGQQPPTTPAPKPKTPKTPAPQPPYAPPIYIPPWQPGPPTQPGRTSPPSTPTPDIGLLINSQGQTNEGTLFGNTEEREQIAFYIDSDLAYILKGIKVKLGKVGTPTDAIQCELWRYIPGFRPMEIVTNGTATLIQAASLPTWAADQSDVTIYFPDNPQTVFETWYALIFYRTGSIDADNHYKFGWYNHPIWATTYYTKNPPDQWASSVGWMPDIEIWGTLL